MSWSKLMLLRILDQVYHIQIKAVTVNVTSTMYTLAISLAASRVEGIGPTRISGQQNQPHRHQATQDSGQGKRLKSATSRNGRVPGGLVRDSESASSSLQSGMT